MKTTPTLSYTKRHSKYSFVSIALIFWFTALSLSANEPASQDYAALFGKNYRSALAFLEGQKWIGPQLREWGLDPAWAIAIAFPEMIRYSAILDSIETWSLEVLYVQYGKKYANFSIGRFQMKPSFVEQLETDAATLLSAEERRPLLPADIPKSKRAARRQRLKRLHDLRWNLRYLALFIRIMEKRCLKMEVPFTDEKEKLVFFATAYNVGYTKNEEKIRREIGLKRFHTKPLHPQRFFPYADISLYFYRNFPAASSNPQF